MYDLSRLTEEVQSALTKISPDCDMREWFAVLSAGVNGDIPKEILKDWSSGGATYKDRDFEYHYRRAQASGQAPLATIFKKAYENGWQGLKYKSFEDLPPIYKESRYLIRVDGVARDHKPDDNPGALTENFKKIQLKRVTARELGAEMLKGAACQPCAVDITANADAVRKFVFREQSFIFVDIDNGKKVDGKFIPEEEIIYHEKALEICKKEQLLPFLIYPTFSDGKYTLEDGTPVPRYRLCFVLNTPLRSETITLSEREKILKTFIKIFGAGADVLIDPGRQMYGTNKPALYENYEAVVNLPYLLKWVEKKETEAKEKEDATKGIDSLGKYVDEFKHLMQENVIPLKTGIHNLDIALCGGLTSELYLLNADTNTGKSALAFHIALNLVKQGHKVLYYALEMSKAEFFARGTSMENFKRNLATTKSDQRAISLSIPYGEILNFEYDKKLNVFTKVSFEKYEDDLKSFVSNYGNGLFIVEGGIEGKSAGKIAEEVKQFRNENPADDVIVIIDYLQLLKAEPESAGGSKMDIVSDAAFTLKTLASQSAKCPVLAISSKSNESSGTKSEAMNIKHSGDAAYTAGVIIGYDWEGTERNNENAQAIKAKALKDGYRVVQLVVTKNRSGAKDNGFKFKYYPAFNYFDTSENMSSVESVKINRNERERKVLLDAYNSVAFYSDTMEIDGEMRRGVVTVQDIADYLNITKSAVRKRISNYGGLVLCAGDTVSKDDFKNTEKI